MMMAAARLGNPITYAGVPLVGLGSGCKPSTTVSIRSGIESSIGTSSMRAERRPAAMVTLPGKAT